MKKRIISLERCNKLIFSRIQKGYFEYEWYTNMKLPPFTNKIKLLIEINANGKVVATRDSSDQWITINGLNMCYDAFRKVTGISLRPEEGVTLSIRRVR